MLRRPSHLMSGRWRRASYRFKSTAHLTLFSDRKELTYMLHSRRKAEIEVLSSLTHLTKPSESKTKNTGKNAMDFLGRYAPILPGPSRPLEPGRTSQQHIIADHGYHSKPTIKSSQHPKYSRIISHDEPPLLGYLVCKISKFVTLTQACAFSV